MQAWWVAGGLRLPRVYALWTYFETMGMKPDINARILEVRGFAETDSRVSAAPSGFIIFKWAIPLAA